jgi:translation initiation factor 1A
MLKTKDKQQLLKKQTITRENLSLLNHKPHQTHEHAFKEQQHSLNQQPRGLRLGKKKVLSEGALHEMIYPSQGEVLGVVTKLLGFDRIMVKCQDGKERLCRIRGKMKRRVWIREGDIVIVSPWDFQTDKRGDVVWRYTHAQADTLRRKGYLTV